MKQRQWWTPIGMAAAILWIILPCPARGQGDGFLYHGGKKMFPIGSYELPGDDGQLQAMAAAGINIVRCGSRKDLDRAKAAGMTGWVPIDLYQGATDALRQRIKSLQDHDALVMWEGPDELVEQFTGMVAKLKAVGLREKDWWTQHPENVAYAEKEARRIIPAVRGAIQLIRDLDPHNRQVWINESNRADVHYVRQYMDLIDITGCDDYPVKRDTRDIARIGGTVERWKRIGKGKPVWMVLQAFSWGSIYPDNYPEGDVLPTFAETRFMAYDAIVHGARGVMYWGSHFPVVPEFRQSLYALTSELSVLQPFLTASLERTVEVELIEGNRPEDGSAGREDVDWMPTSDRVKISAYRRGRDWLILLVNEDKFRHMGVAVSGLDHLNGIEMNLLYGAEDRTVKNGGFVTRMQPFEVKVFATGRQWETPWKQGRGFDELLSRAVQSR